MSYRDLKNFTEMMRALGYPRHISMENFRTPNFPLVAEILIWLLNRYEPNIDLPAEIDTEQDRIIFIRSVAQFMASKAHIKLNMKKLYQADGYAVKELSKLTSVLYEAIQSSKHKDAASTSNQNKGNVKFELSNKLQEAKIFRQLASDITNKGATLYDLFAKEVELRDLRSTVIAKHVEVTEVESWINTSSSKLQDDLEKTKQLIENVASDEVNLDAKIEKKKVELDRNQKRLQTLQKVRPEFMDEYEKLEEELKRCYEIYMVKFRCLAYLEQLLEEHEWTEKEKMEERENAMRKMMEKLKLEESLNADVEGEGETFGGFDDTDLTGGSNGRTLTQRPQQAHRFVTPGLRELPETRRKFGSMTGGDIEETNSQLSDSDLELIDGDDPGSEVGSDEIEIDSVPVAAARIVNSKESNRPQSDDDF